MLQCAASGLALLAMTSAPPSAGGTEATSTIRLVQYEVVPRREVPNQRGTVAAPPQIQIVNDPASGGDVRFVIDGREYSLRSGGSVNLSGDRPHRVEFSSGGTAGDRQFTLHSGVYKFKVMPDGWMLCKSSSPPLAASEGERTPGVPAPPVPHPDLAKRRLARASAATSGAGRASPPTAGDHPATVDPKPPAPGITAPSSKTDGPRPPLKAPVESAENPPPPPTVSEPN
jgi:hypothetical protein